MVVNINGESVDVCTAVWPAPSAAHLAPVRDVPVVVHMAFAVVPFVADAIACTVYLAFAQVAVQWAVDEEVHVLGADYALHCVARAVALDAAISIFFAALPMGHTSGRLECGACACRLACGTFDGPIVGVPVHVLRIAVVAPASNGHRIRM